MKISIKTVLYAAIALIIVTNYSCSKDDADKPYYYEGVRIANGKFNSIRASFPSSSSTPPSPEGFGRVEDEWLQYKANADKVIQKRKYATENSIINYLTSNNVPLNIAELAVSSLNARGNLIISDNDTEAGYKIVYYYEKVER